VSAPAVVGNRRAVADIGVQVIAQVANLALGVVVTAVIARQLGTTSFGEMATILAVIQVTGFLADLKLQEVTMLRVAAEPEREHHWFGAYVALRAVLAVPVALIAAIVLVALSRSEPMRVAGVIASVNILIAPLSIGTLIFRQRVRNDINMAAVTFTSVVWGTAALVICATGGGLVPLVAGLTMCNVITGTLLASFARRRAPVRVRGSRSAWGGLLRTGAAVGLAGLLSLAYARIDQVIVYGLAPHHSDAGIYGGVARIYNTAAFLPVAVMTTIFPLAAGAHGRDPDRLRSLVQTSVDYLAMLAFPIFAFCLVAAAPVLHLLLGPAYVSGAGGLQILMAAYVVVCFGYVSGNMLIVLGRQRRFAIYALVGLVVNVAFNVELVPRYGYIAAAWVTLLTEALVIGLSLRDVFGAVALRLKLGRLARTAVAAMALGVLLLALRDENFGLALLVIAALVTWPLLLLLMGSLDIDELRELRAGRLGE
jgi:O-antigen/teichoic acid export membrane protein